MKLADAAVGRWAVRMLAGSIPMKLKVTAVTDTEVHCGGWYFDRETGAEIDDDLGWGPQYGVSGSHIDHFEDDDKP